MGDLAVIQDQRGACLVTTGPLTASLIHQVARSFTEHQPDSPGLRHELRQVFGTHQLRWYVVDQRSDRAVIQFSNRVRPDTLAFRGNPICFTDNHAAELVLTIRDAAAHMTTDYGGYRPGMGFLGAL